MPGAKLRLGLDPDHHDGVVVPVDNLTSAAGPDRGPAAVGRDHHTSAGARERLDVHLVPARLGRDVGQPTARRVTPEVPRTPARPAGTASHRRRARPSRSRSGPSPAKSTRTAASGRRVSRRSAGGWPHWSPTLPRCRYRPRAERIAIPSSRTSRPSRRASRSDESPSCVRRSLAPRSTSRIPDAAGRIGDDPPAVGRQPDV